jgi:predicted metal-dependent TIM-barrel fold hydrolase
METALAVQPGEFPQAEVNGIQQRLALVLLVVTISCSRKIITVTTVPAVAWTPENALRLQEIVTTSKTNAKHKAAKNVFFIFM